MYLLVFPDLSGAEKVAFHRNTLLQNYPHKYFESPASESKHSAALQDAFKTYPVVGESFSLAQTDNSSEAKVVSEAEMRQHYPQKTPKNVRCMYCQLSKTTSKSGWDIFTKYQCSKCNVPLCTSFRKKANCFTAYHQQFHGFNPGQFNIVLSKPENMMKLYPYKLPQYRLHPE